MFGTNLYFDFLPKLTVAQTLHLPCIFYKLSKYFKDIQKGLIANTFPPFSCMKAVNQCDPTKA